jgi:hypothetical protein
MAQSLPRFQTTCLTFVLLLYVECCVLYPCEYCDEHANTEPTLGVLVHWTFLRVGASVFHVYLNVVPKLSSDLDSCTCCCARSYGTVL